MTNPTPSKALSALSALRLIPLVVVLILINANISKAEEGIQPLLQANAELQTYSGQQEKLDNSMDELNNKDDWSFSLGIGSMYAPSFVGSRDYQAMIVPDIKVEYKDRFFASPFGVGYNIINSDGLRIGPIMKFDFGRSEDDDNPFRIAGKKTNALKGLGDIDAALELGGFVEYEYKMFSCGLEVRQGVGGHEGLVGEASLNYKGSADILGKPIMYAIGPRATFADSNYNDAYFGITQTQSANSGLARYSADAGLVSYGIGAFAVMPISDSVSLGLFGGYDRLAGQAADSPLIKERGAVNQFMSGVRITYEFGYSPGKP